MSPTWSGPRHNKRDHPLGVPVSVLAGASDPLEAGFGLPKLVEESGELAGDGDAGALGAFALRQRERTS